MLKIRSTWFLVQCRKYSARCIISNNVATFNVYRVCYDGTTASWSEWNFFNISMLPVDRRILSMIMFGRRRLSFERQIFLLAAVDVLSRNFLIIGNLYRVYKVARMKLRNSYLEIFEDVTYIHSVRYWLNGTI